MNEILKGYAEKALEWLSEGIGFVAKEVPIYIEELLRWKIFEEGLHVFIGLLFIVWFIVLLKKYLPVLLSWDYAKSSSAEDGRHIYEIILLSMSFICFLVGLYEFFLHIHGFVKILVAPRVYLLEYVTGLLSKTTA